MSLSPEYAKEHANDPAVLCCRAEEGTELKSSNLEDPAIFPDLVDSGLLNTDGALKIGQVLNGSKLTKTLDSLTPVTPDVIDRYDEAEAPAAEEAAPASEEGPAGETAAPAVQTAGGVMNISIGEGKDIKISIPTGLGAGGAAAVKAVEVPAESGAAAVPEGRDEVVRELTRKHFKITEVKRGPETKLEGTVLTIREGIEKDCVKSEELVKDFKLEVVTPDNYHVYSQTIMDVQPIATKEGDADLGEGVTRVIDGAVMMLTGTDENGVQIGEFGSSEGYLDENILFGRPGCPDVGDILIKGEVTIEAGRNMERRGPMSAHIAMDVLTQEIRVALKNAEEDLVVDTEVIQQTRHPGKPKIAIVKEIMGQGAMHDNFLLPMEPVGVLGARANVDLGNVPVIVSPLELLDGCIHALTCIGPGTKEMSRHYWREPLVLECMKDPEIDLVAVVLVGSPQANSEKFYVSKRVGMTVESLDVAGAFVTTEGFGNNHVDFTSHIEQIGKRGIPCVGFSFCATQGALVVGNKYMTAMIDNNKADSGIENGVLGNSTLCEEDAIRGLAMLKDLIEGVPIKAPERSWNPAVKQNNIEIIEKAQNRKIDLVENERSIPKSKERLEKYGDI
jgi:D-proline reductase (dithiol) PrdA